MLLNRTSQQNSLRAVRMKGGEEAGWDWKPSFAKRQKKKKKHTGGYSHIEVFRACFSRIFCKGNPVSPKTKNKTKQKNRDRPGSRGDLGWGYSPIEGFGAYVSCIFCKENGLCPLPSSSLGKREEEETHTASLFSLL